MTNRTGQFKSLSPVDESCVCVMKNQTPVDDFFNPGIVVHMPKYPSGTVRLKRFNPQPLIKAYRTNQSPFSEIIINGKSISPTKKGRRD